MGSGNEIAQDVGQEITKQAGTWQNIVNQCGERPNRLATKVSSACDQLPSLQLTKSNGEQFKPEQTRVSEVRQALGDLSNRKMAQFLFPETAEQTTGSRCVSFSSNGEVDLTDPKGPKYQLPVGFDQQAERLIGGLSAAEATQILQVGKVLGADRTRMIEAALAVSSISCIRRKNDDGTIEDAALDFNNKTDVQEVSLLIKAYEKVLAGVGDDSPVSTIFGDLLPPIKGTMPEDNLKNVIKVLNQFALPALEAEFKSKN